MVPLIRSLALVLAGLVLTSNAFSWGNAAHTYMAKKLGQKFGAVNMNEMYGAVLNDAFGYELESSYGMTLDYLLHNNADWAASFAATCDLKAVAFGIASHSDKWGADRTAHHHGLTYGQSKGWIIAKAELLAPSLYQPVYEIIAGALPGYPTEAIQGLTASLVPEFAHDLCETAVDLMVKKYLDPLVGYRIVLAAQNRPAETAALLYQAYGAAVPPGADPLDVYIATKEAEYNGLMAMYGGIMTMPFDEAVAGLAYLSSEAGKLYIGAAIRLYVDPNYAGTPDVSPDLVAGLIAQAIPIVKSGYVEELFATTIMVEQKLRAKGIGTCCTPYALWKEGAEEENVSESELPTRIELTGNYPNPFNPATTIEYRLPEPQFVTLKVFNNLGQEVATLVDGEMPAGVHRVVWNANGVASGVYFARLQSRQTDGGQSRQTDGGQARSFLETRKMVLAK